MLLKKRVNNTNKDIMNLPVPSQQSSMSGSRRLELENSSSSEQNLPDEIPITTGMRLKLSPKKTSWKRFHRIYLFDITVHWFQLPLITQGLRRMKSVLPCFMDPLVEVKVILPGSKPDQMLIQRILAPNSGMATKVKKTLLSMNLEEALTSVTCCDGWIVTRLWWRSREVANAYKLGTFGLPQICTPTIGTNSLMSLQD